MRDEPRAMPRVLQAWRAMGDTPPVVVARCKACDRELGRVFDSTMGALLHYFQPVAARAMDVTVDDEDRDWIRQHMLVDHPERYSVKKWAAERDRALVGGLDDDAGTLLMLDRDDYWLQDDWSCPKHGFLPIDRAQLMDQVRQARSGGKARQLFVDTSTAQR